MTKVKCRFCNEIIEVSDFKEHVLNNHVYELVDDTITYTTIMEYAEEQ